jgi:thiol-disulfide isomerase/thioredoxin
MQTASQLTVLTRANCELCEQFLLALSQLAQRYPLPPIAAADVDENEELARRYGLKIPVLLLDGTFVCATRFDAEELLRILRIAPR